MSRLSRSKTPRRSLGHTNLVSQDPAFVLLTLFPSTLFGSLPTSKSGNKYIVVLQCLFLVTPFSFLFRTYKRKLLSLPFVLRLFSEHGAPRILLSDNGASYSSTLIKVLMMTLRVSHRYSPAYHPQSNGQVDRFMSTLCQMISSYTEDTQDHVHWDQHLGIFQLAYNLSVHAETG